MTSGELLDCDAYHLLHDLSQRSLNCIVVGCGSTAAQEGVTALSSVRMPTPSKGMALSILTGRRHASSLIQMCSTPSP